MIICKKLHPVHTSVAQRGLVLSALMVSLTGCGMLGSVMEADKVDYKGASKKVQTLDVPPDLTQLSKDNRYALPDANRGVATASGYSQQRGSAPLAADSVTPVAVAAAGSEIRVERAGNQRWLVVKQSPEALWPKLKEFWLDAGFPVTTEMQTAGIMETDWAENRAKIPQDILRRTIGKVFDSLYSTGERDKFRTRLERAADNSTEIYISHRGAQEVLTGSQKETTTWTSRPNDPGLEAQFLARLMTRLSNAEAPQAKAAVDNAAVQPATARLVSGAGGAQVQVDEAFDRTWRRVGLALDRVGFTVEDRDRAQGLYFVRYVDQDATKKGGFLSKLFSFGSASDKDKEAQRYRISVKAGAGTSSVVTVQDNQGKADASPTAGKILGLLNDQLK